MVQSKKNLTKKKPQSKGTKKDTRQKILAAAQEVFCNHPYHSASIRMIGKLAEFQHPLISYYFPSKADLFLAVLEDLTARQTQSQKRWLEEIKLMTPARGFAVALDYELDLFRQQPGLYRLTALNMIQSDNTEPIPGYHLIQRVTKQNIRNFIEIVSLSAPEYEVEMFCRVVMNHLVNFLGAARFHAAMMNLDPNSIQYMNWVKDAALNAFLPRLQTMVVRNDGYPG